MTGTQDEDDDDLLSTIDVAGMLKITRTTVRAIPADQLPYVEKPGSAIRRGRRRYRRADVEAYLRSRRHDGSPPGAPGGSA